MHGHELMLNNLKSSVFSSFQTMTHRYCSVTSRPAESSRGSLPVIQQSLDPLLYISVIHKRLWFSSFGLACINGLIAVRNCGDMYCISQLC